MSRTWRLVALVGALTLVGSLLSASTTSAAVAAPTTYVVLATAGVDSAIAAVEAAGGRVQRVNRAVGLVTASSSRVSFAATVSARTGVAGVARDRPIGSAPREAVQRRAAVETEGRHPGPSGSEHGDGAAEPLAPLQWDMRMIGATPDGSYDEQPGRKDVLVGIIDTGIDGHHPDIAPNFNRK